MDASKIKYQWGAECTKALGSWLKTQGLSKIDEPGNNAIWNAWEQNNTIESAIAASGLSGFDPREEFPLDDFLTHMPVKSGPLLAIFADANRFKSQLEQTKAKWDEWVSNRALTAIIPEAEYKFSGYSTPRDYAKNSPVNLLLQNAGIPGSAFEEKLKKEERKFIEGCRVYECKRVYWSFVLDWWKKYEEPKSKSKKADK